MEIKYKIKLISDCFYKGNYTEALNILGRVPIAIEENNIEDLTAFQVGSLVFTGEFQEAKVLFERIVQNTTPSMHFLFRCRFFLGIACTRNSNYSGAAHYFAINLKNLAKAKAQVNINSREKNEIVFYTFQGSAFYRFYKGRYKLARDLATKAYNAAFEGQFSYGLIFSLDLLGHSLCKLGYIRRGIFELERIQKHARELGNKGVENGILVSIITFKAQFGFDLKNDIMKLKDAIKSLNIDDNYSRGQLYLELIHQLILRGQIREAQYYLDQVGSIIYINQNKRQSAFFNLRCAQMMILKGELYAALALVNSLRSNLDPKVDFFINRQVDFIEENIKSLLKNPNAVIPLETRSYFYSPEVNNKGEDPLGDILDQAHNGNITYFYEVKANGLLGLIPQILGLPLSFKGIYLGPSRNEMIIINSGNIHCIDKGLSGTLRKLIKQLEGVDFKSKESLINSVWGYQYNPQIHDNLLHSSIGKIRNLLNENGVWIEWSNEGYRLTPSILIKETQEIKAVLSDSESQTNQKNRNLENISQPKQEVEIGLNIRQLKLIKLMKSNDYIGVSDYSRKFRICKMTACRDLTNLHKNGYMIRIGKGRATVYRLA